MPVESAHAIAKYQRPILQTIPSLAFNNSLLLLVFSKSVMVLAMVV